MFTQKYHFWSDYFSKKVFLHDQHKLASLIICVFTQLLPNNNRITFGCLPIIGKIFTLIIFRQPLDNPAYFESEKPLLYHPYRDFKGVSVSIPAVNIGVNLWTSLWSVSCIKSQNFLPQHAILS